VLDKPVSYSVVYQRLIYYLTTLGIYDGETPHNFRAGWPDSETIFQSRPNPISSKIFTSWFIIPSTVLEAWRFGQLQWKAKSHVLPKQAKPIFLTKVKAISSFIDREIKIVSLSLREKLCTGIKHGG
jgi:hypothetical protein